MKAEKIVQALNEVDDKYIEEAAIYKNKSRNSLRIWRIVAIAACVCLAGSLGLVAVSLNSGNNASYRSAEESGTLPKRTSDFAAEASYDTYFEAPEMEMAMYSDAVMLDSAADNGTGNGLWTGADAGKAQESGASADTAEAVPANDTAKIIYYVWMTMQTTEFDSAAEQIENIVSQHGAYFSNQYISNASAGYRSASYTVRVPAENLDSFLAQTGQVCTVISVSKNAEDVSESYYDTESRLTTAKAKLARLQELLAEAEDMEDIISIESAISDVEYEIDSLSGTLRYYDNRVSYSTVDISLNEVYEVKKEEAPKSFGEKLSIAFSNSIEGIGNFFKALVLWLAECWFGILLFAAVIAAVTAIIVKIVKKCRKKR
ncbi:MAG: DUF4349 domain-containing protein [Parasporobacterium sp.]|nr:DUF4349 domain-containing protein [Parasporobacterium sp.]